MFKGFLITLTLPREEVVTVRGPINRAQPPFTRFSLTGFHSLLPNFLSHFRVHSGLGTLGAAHGHLDPPFRSPTSPTLHRAVTGASVPTPFSLTCRGCLHPEKEISEGSVAPRGPTAIPFATGTVRLLGSPEALGLFPFEAVRFPWVYFRVCR
ncbi:hypothetical protein CRG98_005071 [Punica granatum]|uniref:Uncharacterized protein n=1 Tax=Punica granatum TaxID=22663 RepID=A0A2I0L1E7_PUNGR|nr:hypothetical protein CRG98_005071 [Punica granatum]